MKVVLNKRFGGFNVSKEWAMAHGYESGWEVHRMDPELVAAIEAGEEVSGPCALLTVAEIPAEATDWEINNYDGVESVIAVIDGKLVHI